ncbi:hypothetical protein [Cellvibrio mixtus]|nr:hypothetical protein [Cellvibrio mixtus]
MEEVQKLALENGVFKMLDEHMNIEAFEKLFRVGQISMQKVGQF